MSILLVNLTDLDMMGTIPMIGSPLNLLVNKEFGDNLLNTSIYDTRRIDEMYVVIESSNERLSAINEALQVLGKKKINRKIRTEIKTKLPTGEYWKTVQYNKI